MRVHQVPAQSDRPVLGHTSLHAAKRAQVCIKQRPTRKHRSYSSTAPRRSRTLSAARRDELPTATQPFSIHDVDRELWMVLDLASDTELEGVHDMLFGKHRCSICNRHRMSCHFAACADS